jgi:Lar family restriction alleviation protein
MIIVTMTVKAYVKEGMDSRNAIESFMYDQDWVSYCDVDTLGEVETKKTFPEDDCDGGEKVSEYKPCPFCGERDEDAFEYTSSQKTGNYRVFCLSCCGSGPKAKSKPMALKAWNNRVDVK